MNKVLTLTALVLFSFILSSNSFSQDNDKIKEGIPKAYELFSNGNLSGLDKYIDAGYLEHTLARGQKQGLDGLIETIKSLRKAFPDLKFTVNDIIISGDKAAVLNTLTGTNTGEFMGMPATNKTVTVMGIDWLVFNKDNKCTEHWGYFDDMGMMQQLGLMK